MDALNFASSRMSDGEVVGFDELARYTSDDLAIVEVEYWRASGSDRRRRSVRDQAPLRRAYPATWPKHVSRRMTMAAVPPVVRTSRPARRR